MSLFSSKKDSECVLVFDIGSGSVGGAIVLTSKGHTPAILYSFRSDIPFQEEATGLRLLSLMIRSLSQVVLALCHEGFDAAGFGSERPKIEEAFISLSAPWVISKTSLLKLQNQTPLTITPEVFSSLLKHSAEETQPSQNDVPKGSFQIERKLIKSILNGYETSSPYEKKATEAEFALFSSFSASKVTEKISDTITELIHPKTMSFHSFALLTFVALRELYPHEEHFLAVDVSGEQTELSIVKKGVLVETVTFPFGRNHLIRTLKKSIHVPALGAEAFFKLYASKSGTGKLYERVRKVLELSEENWRNEFQKTLTTFSEEFFLPKSLFITADDDVTPIFMHAIGRGDFSKFMISPGAFRTLSVNAELLAPLVKWNPSGARDPFIGLIASSASHL